MSIDEISKNIESEFKSNDENLYLARAREDIALSNNLLKKLILFIFMVYSVMIFILIAHGICSCFGIIFLNNYILGCIIISTHAVAVTIFIGLIKYFFPSYSKK